MPTIAVFGACHLDTVGYFEGGDEGIVDIPGARVDYSVGGAGYNVAVHLAERGHTIRFFMPVVPRSLSDLIVRRSLQDRGISEEYLVSSGQVSSAVGGFVAIRQGFETKLAVTATAYDNADLREEEIRRVLQGADAAILDTNLTTTQIVAVVRACDEFNVPVSCLVASDAKAVRLRDALKHCREYKPFLLLSMNVLEARKFFGENVPTDELTPEHLAEVPARILCITKGKGGLDLYMNSVRHQFRPYSVIPISGNELGVGDALFAGFCDYLARKKRQTPEELFEHSRQFALPILDIQTATKDAAVFHPFSVGEGKIRIALRLVGISTVISLAAFAVLIGSWSQLPLSAAIFLLFMASFCSGLAGGVASLLSAPASELTRGNETIILRRSILGGIAGLFAFFVYSIPHFAGGASMHSEAQTIIFLFMVCLIAFGAGYAGERALEELIRSAGHAVRDKKE